MTDIHKKESKPLFKPCKDVNFINGSPVNTDKLSERYNQSRFRNNERPFKQERIGAGLNDKDGRKGLGGFHQTEVQDIARASYKDIDDAKLEEVINYIEFLKDNPS